MLVGANADAAAGAGDVLAAAVEGEPVERLRLADSCLNTATCEHRTTKFTQS